jgi:uncharacterized protein (TIGR02594 family)
MLNFLYETNQLAGSADARDRYFFFWINRFRNFNGAGIGRINGSIVPRPAEPSGNGSIGNGDQSSTLIIDSMKNTPLLIALSYYGETPLAGPLSNPQIQEFLAAAGMDPNSPDETPWCSAFLVWCYQQSGIPVSANAAAVSWMSVGKEVSDPVVGDVVVLAWPPEQIQHAHVGLFIREVANGIYILAGNQGNTVDISLWKKADVLGYRRT